MKISGRVVAGFKTGDIGSGHEIVCWTNTRALWPPGGTGQPYLPGALLTVDLTLTWSANAAYHTSTLHAWTPASGTRWSRPRFSGWPTQLPPVTSRGCPRAASGTRGKYWSTVSELLPV